MSESITEREREKSSLSEALLDDGRKTMIDLSLSTFCFFLKQNVERQRERQRKKKKERRKTRENEREREREN